MYKKEITPVDADKFWNLFIAKHPDIADQFSGKALVNDAIVAFQPKVMTDESYSIYNRFLRRWYADNGYMEAQPDLIYVSLNDDHNKTVMELDTSMIKSIEPANSLSISKVVIEGEGETKTIFIKMNFEELKKIVYIF